MAVWTLLPSAITSPPGRWRCPDRLRLCHSREERVRRIGISSSDTRDIAQSDDAAVDAEVDGQKILSERNAPETRREDLSSWVVTTPAGVTVFCVLRAWIRSCRSMPSRPNRVRELNIDCSSGRPRGRPGDVGTCKSLDRTASM